MSMCMLTPAIEAALERYREKFKQHYPIELLPQEDENDIIEQIEKAIAADRPDPRQLDPKTKY